MPSDDDAKPVAIPRYVVITRRVPICQVHGLPMLSKSGNKDKPWIRYFACSVDGCKCRERGEYRTSFEF